MSTFQVPTGEFHGVRVTETTDQTITTGGTGALVTFSAETYDTNGYHSTSSQTSRITIPTGRDGYYHITGKVRWDTVTGAGTYRRIRLYKNGSDISTAQGAESIFREGYGGPPIDTILYLTAGDYIELNADHDRGSDLTLKNSFAAAYFQAVLVSATSGAPAMVKLDQVVLSADGTITFPSIVGTFESLKIMFHGQSAAGADEGLSARFNGDSGSNYDHERAVGVGTSNAAGGANNASLMYLSEIPRTANTSRPGSVEITIPGYARTVFYKACHAIGSDLRGGGSTSDVIVTMGAGLWRSTSAITSVTLLSSGGGSLKAGSVATLYGLS